MDVYLLPDDGTNRPDKSDNPDKESPEKPEAPEAPPKPLLEMLCRLNGRTSLFWTCRALQDSARVRSVKIVCPPDDVAAVRAEVPDDSRFDFYEWDSLEPFGDIKFSNPDPEAFTQLSSLLTRIVAHPTLCLTCSAPLASGAAYDALIARFNESACDSAVVLVPTEKVQEVFGIENIEGQRVFNGAFYLPNAIVIGPRAIAGAIRLMERLMPVMQRMEEPKTRDMFLFAWTLGRVFGFRFLMRVMRSQATIPEIQKKLSRVLKAPFAILVLDEPSLAVKPSDEKQRALIEAKLR